MPVTGFISLEECDLNLQRGRRLDSHLQDNCVPCPQCAGPSFQYNVLDAHCGAGTFARASLFLEGFLCQTSHQLMNQCHPKNRAMVPLALAVCVCASGCAQKHLLTHAAFERGRSALLCRRSV